MTTSQSAWAKIGRPRMLPDLSRRGAPARREAAVEGLALPRHVDQQLRWRKTLPARLLQPPTKIDERLRPHHVDIGQRAAAERRKPEAEDRAHVGLAHVGDDAFLHAAGGLERLNAEQAGFELRDVD